MFQGVLERFLGRSWENPVGPRAQGFITMTPSARREQKEADMEVPSESFHWSSWDSRTCYPWRAFNQGLTDDGSTVIFLFKSWVIDGYLLNLFLLLCILLVVFFKTRRFGFDNDFNFLTFLLSIDFKILFVNLSPGSSERILSAIFNIFLFE